MASYIGRLSLGGFFFLPLFHSDVSFRGRCTANTNLTAAQSSGACAALRKTPKTKFSYFQVSKAKAKATAEGGCATPTHFLSGACAARLRRRGRVLVDPCAGLPPCSSTGTKGHSRKSVSGFAFRDPSLRSHPKRALRVGDPGALDDKPRRSRSLGNVRQKMAESSR